jgi:hypothetical protein|tara:strand:- start:97 stop:231 length:135 start_codon:yes stop_codon:yes gene_type:complete
MKIIKIEEEFVYKPPKANPNSLERNRKTENKKKIKNKKVKVKVY